MSPPCCRSSVTPQDAAMTTYGWVNQGAEIVRLPIDRAKALVIERGLPVRQARRRRGAGASCRPPRR